MNFEHDYTVANEISSTDQVLCMRCGVPIMVGSYIEMPKHNNPKETVAVYTPRKLSNYRQVPVESMIGERYLLTHVLVCEGCQTFDLTPEIAEKIVAQIARARVAQLAWSGYPAEAGEASRIESLQLKILRRLQGNELVGHYTKEKPYAGNI